MSGAKLRNCSQCGRPFQKVRDPLCPQCMKALEEEFESVRLYLLDNPESSVAMVAQETGVDSKKIMKFLRDGRLGNAADKMPASLNCTQCGTDIRFGTHCDACAKKLAAQMSSAVSGAGKAAGAAKPKPRGKSSSSALGGDESKTGFFSYRKKGE